MHTRQTCALLDCASTNTNPWHTTAPETEPLVAHVREVFLLAVAKHNGLTPERDDFGWKLTRWVDPIHGDVVYRAPITEAIVA